MMGARVQRYALNPGEGIQVKHTMKEDQVAHFAWTTKGSGVNSDFHGDGGGNGFSQERGRAVPEAIGDPTAAFTGNCGWFWRIRTDAHRHSDAQGRKRLRRPYLQPRAQEDPGRDRQRGQLSEREHGDLPEEWSEQGAP